MKNRNVFKKHSVVTDKDIDRVEFWRTVFCPHVIANLFGFKKHSISENSKFANKYKH